MTAAADDSTTYTLYYRPDGAAEARIGRGLSQTAAEAVRRELGGRARIEPDTPPPPSAQPLADLIAELRQMDPGEWYAGPWRHQIHPHDTPTRS